MAETPTLYVHPDPTSTLYRPASSSEILSAARPYLDYEAAAKAVVRVAGTGTGEDGYVKVWVDQHADAIARAVAAALGLTEEGT